MRVSVYGYLQAILNENAEVNIQQLQLEIKKLKEELTKYKSGSLIPQEPAKGECNEGKKKITLDRDYMYMKFFISVSMFSATKEKIMAFAGSIDQNVESHLGCILLACLGHTFQTVICLAISGMYL